MIEIPVFMTVVKEKRVGVRDTGFFGSVGTNSKINCSQMMESKMGAGVGV